MKAEWKWLTAFGVISILIIGLMTDFKFTNFEIQMHDTYFVVDSIRGIIYLTFLLWTMKNLYLVVDLMTNKYKIIALLISIINPLIGLLIFTFLYMSAQELMTFKEIYPDKDFAGQVIPICILISLMALQTIIEIRMLKKVWAFFSN